MSDWPDVRAMTRAERRRLVREVIAANAEHPTLSEARKRFARLRTWVLVLAVVAVAVLLPWTFNLAWSLPQVYRTENWPLTWVGFDAALTLGFALTGFLVWRRSPLAGHPALATGVLLLCDAWFDLTLSRGGEFRSALFSALALEIPIGVALVVLGTRQSRLLWRR